LRKKQGKIDYDKNLFCISADSSGVFWKQYAGKAGREKSKESEEFL